MGCSIPPTWGSLEPSFEPFGLAVAEGREGTAEAKSSISHFGVDALECLRRRSFLSQLDWLRSEHNHRFCSLSSLLHHYNPHDIPSSLIATALCLPRQCLYALQLGQLQK